MKPNDILFAQKALLLTPDLSGSARQVGAAIVDHFNKQSGQCDPSIKRLATMTGLSKRTVAYAIKELTSGPIAMIGYEQNGGKFHRNSYSPNFDAFHEFVREWDKRMKSGTPMEKSTGKRRIDGEKPAPRTKQALHSKQCNQLRNANAGPCTQTLKNNPSKNNLSKERKVIEQGSDFAAKMELTGSHPVESELQQSVEFSTTNLKKRTSMTRHEIACERARSRIDRELRDHSLPLERYIDLITPELERRATMSELQKPGTGAKVIIDEDQRMMLNQ